MTEPNGADLVADHLTNCLNVGAAIVMGDGMSGTPTVVMLIEAGWTYDGNVDYVAGKRIRTLIPPPEIAARLASPRCPECRCDPTLCETDETGQYCADQACGTCLHGCPLDECPACEVVR